MTQPPPYPPAPPYSEQDQKLWSTLIHVGGIFFGFLPSLIGYLVARDRGGFIREHTRAALNFQLTMVIAAAAGGVLTLILVGFLVIIAVDVLIIVFSILAAIAANSGQLYRYPVSIEFVK